MVFGFASRPAAAGGPKVAPGDFPDPEQDIPPADAPADSVAVLAGGCFWCVEGVYRQLDGILEAVSGYAGGAADTANYKAVCTGETGHAEVVRLRFDPVRISFGQLLKMFFAVAHDPTQRDRQGGDIGTQYRSAIFYTDDVQRAVAEAYIRQLDGAGVFGAPIATEVTPLETFYEAEAYHQDYAALNPNQNYIACVALPKIQKLREYFPERLKVADKT